MVECPMFKAAAAVIQHYYGPVETGDGKSPVRDMMESDQQHGSRLGNVVGKKCPLAISMRSQSRSVTSVHIILDNLAQGAV